MEAPRHVDVDSATLRRFLTARLDAPKTLEARCLAGDADCHTIALSLEAADGLRVTKYYPAAPASRTPLVLWRVVYDMRSIDACILPERGTARLIFDEWGIECLAAQPWSFMMDAVSYLILVGVPIFMTAVAANLGRGDVAAHE